MRAILLFVAVLAAAATAAISNPLAERAESGEPAEPGEPGALNRDAHVGTTWRHWSYSRPISIGPDAIEQRLVRVPITGGVFAKADVSLSDLRIIDDSGSETGFVLFENAPDPGGEHWYQTKTIDSGYVPGKYTQAVADAGNSDRVHNLVKIELLDRRNEFFAWAEISSSPDYETWRTLRTRAPVYHFRETGEWQAMRVTYPPTRDRWLRLRLQREDEAVPIASLRVGGRIPTDTEAELEDAGIALELSESSPANESWWESHSERRTGRIDGVRIETLREEFHRPLRVSVSGDDGIWREVGHGLVYRLLGYQSQQSQQSRESRESRESDGDIVRESLQVEFRRGDSDKFWRVAVLDGDDAPIDDLTVTLLRAVRSVVFRPQAGHTYTLLYGHPRAEYPEYELTQLLDHVQMAAAPLGALGAEDDNPGFVSSEPFSERYPLLMWAALALAVLVLATLAIKSLRADPTPSD